MNLLTYFKEMTSNLKYLKISKKGSVVRAIITKKTKDKPRSFFDNIDKWAKDQGASGLAYFTLEQDKEIKGKGPVGKFFSENSKGNYEKM